jgi:hypothetical protein
MVTPKKGNLSRVTIYQAQLLRSWRQQKIYTAITNWEQASPVD